MNRWAIFSHPLSRTRRKIQSQRQGERDVATVNPYLNFNGNTEEAFNFYRSVFGGEFLALMRFKDNPDCGNIAEAEQDGIMHIALPIGNGNILMGTDALESMGQKLTPRCGADFIVFEASLL
jgi:hypothetical protein